jgi:predicted nucleic acid-binding protein
MLYLDTSALVKLYLDEAGRNVVTAAVAAEEVVATQELAYIETHAAFSRAERDGRLTHEELDRLRGEFERDWPSYFVVRVSPPLLEQAVKLVDSFALRAYDAVHLSAAQTLLPEAADGMLFGCFDRRLNNAAAVLGMRVLQGASTINRTST